MDIVVTNLDGSIFPSSGTMALTNLFLLLPQAVVRAALVVMKQMVAVRTVVVEVVVDT